MISSYLVLVSSLRNFLWRTAQASGCLQSLRSSFRGHVPSLLKKAARHFIRQICSRWHHVTLVCLLGRGWLDQTWPLCQRQSISYEVVEQEFCSTRTMETTLNKSEFLKRNLENEGKFIGQKGHERWWITEMVGKQESRVNQSDSKWRPDATGSCLSQWEWFKERR